MMASYFFTSRLTAEVNLTLKIAYSIGQNCLSTNQATMQLAVSSKRTNIYTILKVYQTGLLSVYTQVVNQGTEALYYHCSIAMFNKN